MSAPCAVNSEEEGDIPRIVSNDEDDSKMTTQEWEPLDDADKMAYLIRYETMVRQQEAEDMAVQAHLLPCIHRLMELTTTTANTSDNTQLLQQSVSFAQLQHAWRKLPPTDPMTTDRQFMMLLRLLTQKTGAADATITWAELIQSYKICILGMITLQHLPKGSVERARARDRSLALLSLFEAPASHLFPPEEKPPAADARPMRRRRKWFKKRTRRALPYAALLALLLVGGLWYQQKQQYAPSSSSPLREMGLPKKKQPPRSVTSRHFLFKEDRVVVVDAPVPTLAVTHRHHHPLLGVWSHISS